MSSYNHCVLLGRATRDPEIRHTPQGKTVAEFGLAVNRIGTSDGKHPADFFDIVLWDKLAEVAGTYLKKGHPVLIAGRLQHDTWEDRTTHEKKSRIRVVGESLQLLSSKPSDAGVPVPSSAVRNQPAPVRGPVDNDTEPDEIPY